MALNLVTFVSCFKKFNAEFDMIQQSALYSWRANSIPVILPNNEVGIKERCPGVTFVEGVPRGWEIGQKTGAVLLPDLVDAVLPLISTPMVALISSDMIIPGDFQEHLDGLLKQHGFDAFLESSRHAIKLGYSVSSPEAYLKVQKEPRQLGKEHGLFIMSKYWVKAMRARMPAFLIGRYGWDSWIHRWAEQHVLKRVDCTQDLPVLHCDHDGRLIFLQEHAWGMDAPSSKYNLSLL